MLALLLGCALAPGPSTSPLLDDYGKVSDFTLRDQSDRPIRPADLAGKVWVANFIFTRCPDICPMLSAHMREVVAHYDGNDEVRFVSFSVDPEFDTPAVLATYAATYHAPPDRWLFLTGPLGDVREVVVNAFRQSMEKSPATNPGQPESILHGSRFVVVDREGRIRAFPDPLEEGKVGLYAAVDAALVETGG